MVEPAFSYATSSFRRIYYMHTHMVGPVLLKAAVNTIVARSPFLVFSTPKYCRLQKYNKILFDVCINEMAPFGQFNLSSRAVPPFTVVAEMDVSPQDEMANPQGMQVFAHQRHGLSETLCIFRALRGVQSSPVVFAPNSAVVCGPLQVQAPGETLCFMSALS